LRLGLTCGARADALSLRNVVRSMRKGGAALSIVLLDACRINAPPFGAQTRAALGATRGIRVTACASDAALSGSGTVIAWACSDGEVAFDGNGGRVKNGLFTKHLLRHMAAGNTLETLLGRVKEGVAAESSQRQVPCTSVDTAGDVVLAPNVSVRLKPHVWGDVDAEQRTGGAHTPLPMLLLLVGGAFVGGALVAHVAVQKAGPPQLHAPASLAAKEERAAAAEAAARVAEKAATEQRAAADRAARAKAAAERAAAEQRGAEKRAAAERAADAVAKAAAERAAAERAAAAKAKADAERAAAERAAAAKAKADADRTAAERAASQRAAAERAAAQKAATAKAAAEKAASERAATAKAAADRASAQKAAANQAAAQKAAAQRAAAEQAAVSAAAKQAAAERASAERAAAQRVAEAKRAAAAKDAADRAAAAEAAQRAASERAAARLASANAALARRLTARTRTAADSEAAKAAAVRGALALVRAARVSCKSGLQTQRAHFSCPCHRPWASSRGACGLAVPRAAHGIRSSRMTRTLMLTARRALRRHWPCRALSARGYTARLLRSSMWPASTHCGAFRSAAWSTQGTACAFLR